MCLLLLLITIILLLLIINCFCNKSKFTNLKFSNKMSYEDIINLNKGQKIMTEMFKIFTDLCKTNNIKYWSIGGTLIGAARHEGWIPWDGDIDIGILEEDYNKLKKVIHHLPRDMIFSEPLGDPCSRIRTTKAIYVPTTYSQKHDWYKGLQIDIFLHKNIQNKKIKANGPKWVGVVGAGGKLMIDYDDIFPLKERLFDGIYVYVPHKYEKLCKETWGAFPPPLISVEKRYCHEGSIKIL